MCKMLPKEKKKLIELLKKKKAFPDWLQSVARRTFLEPIIIENVRNAISLDTSKITVRPVLVTSTNPTR